jgi:HK97 family phage portal protein
MPWDILRYSGNKEWIRDDSHFAYSILNTQPNPSCSKFTFMKTLSACVDLNGNGYARIHRDDRGNPVKLELLTGGVAMYLNPDLSVYYIVSDLYNQRTYRVEGEDMIHVLNFSYDGLMGVSTLTHAANMTGLAASADAQAKGFFQSGANMSGIMSVPGKIDSTRADNLKRSLGSALKYDSTTGMAGGIAIVEGGTTFHSITVNPKDAQMIESRTFNVVDICRFFGVHPSKAFDTTTNTYSNVELYQLGYITDTMAPLAKKFDNEFNRKLLRPSQRDKTRIQLRVRELMSSDLDTQSNYYTKMIQCGAYTPNEIRREINQPLIPNGDKSYVQVNMMEVGTKPEPIQNKNTGQ